MENPDYFLSQFVKSINEAVNRLQCDAELITERYQILPPEHLAMMHPSAERWGKVTADLQNLADIFKAFNRDEIDGHSLKKQMGNIFDCVDVDIKY